MIKLQQDEKLLHSFRRHPIVMLAPTIVLILLGLAPYWAYSYFPFGEIAQVAGDTNALLTFLYIIWVTLLWIAFCAAFINYWLDIWVITNNRLIDHEQINLFHREVAITKHDHIQNISIEVRGILATFLEYGDIHVQTAGTNKEFVLRGIVKPKEVKQILSELSVKK